MSEIYQYQLDNIQEQIDSLDRRLENMASNIDFKNDKLDDFVTVLAERILKLEATSSVGK